MVFVQQDKMMTDDEKKLILDLSLGKVSKSEFLECYSHNIDDGSHVIGLLSKAYDCKNADEVEYALLLGFSFGFNEGSLDVLNNLIVKDWHFKHEDIAMLLKQFHSPTSIEFLYHTAQVEYDYLDYDDSYALAVKCIWALGDIQTKLSYERLSQLTASKNQVISAAAEKQLQRFIQ